MKRIRVAVITLCLAGSPLLADDLPAPIIDVHLHALTASHQGPPPLAFCLPVREWPAHDPAGPYVDTFMGLQKTPKQFVRGCENPVWSPETDEALTERTLEIVERRNIIGITSGSLTDVYRQTLPERIIPGIMFSVGSNPPPVDELRAMIESGDVQVIGEVTNQYDGIMPDDPRFEPYLQLAEELDVPVGIHVGPGPPGVAYLFGPNYRARLHSALILEEVLVKYPRLRLYVMHAGWPLGDDMVALLWAHPQVYAGLGVISFALPREEFHRYLQRLVDAGFGNRLMFGSDHMVWPEAIEFAIEGIESTDFLTPQQKRDILYNNAARFFRFSNEQREAHLGRQ
jgi:predicted TIM-barrel fold metal-dependent hydrolase